jgi:alpha-1,2-mannosyltransferase
VDDPEPATGSARPGLVRRLRANWWWVVVAGAFSVWLLLLWPAQPSGHIDYRIYAGAVRSGGRLYQFKHDFLVNGGLLHLGFTYPPFAAVLFWPLAQLGDHTGEQIWLVLTGLATVTFLALVAAAVPRRPPVPWFTPVAIAGGLFLVPATLSGRLGQVNALIALAVMLDLVAIRRGWRWAGAGVGFATAVKLTPAVLVPYYWFCGRRRAAIVAAGAVLACEAVAFVLLPGPSQDYWGGEYKATSRVGDLGSGYSNSIRRFLTSSHLPGGVQTGLWLVLVAVVGVVAYRRAVAAGRRGNQLAAFTIVMCYSYLASPITWVHHLWFMTAAVVLVAGDGSDRRRLLAAGALVLTLLDFWDSAEGPVTSGFRLAALVLIVAFLPIDDPGAGDRPSRPATAGRSAPGGR